MARKKKKGKKKITPLAIGAVVLGVGAVAAVGWWYANRQMSKAIGAGMGVPADHRVPVPQAASVGAPAEASSREESLREAQIIRTIQAAKV